MFTHSCSKPIPSQHFIFYNLHVVSFSHDHQVSFKQPIEKNFSFGLEAITECDGRVVTLVFDIREILGSNFGWAGGISLLFSMFRCSSRQMLVLCHKMTCDLLLSGTCEFRVHIHHAVWRCRLWKLRSWKVSLNNPRLNQYSRSGCWSVNAPGLYSGGTCFDTWSGCSLLTEFFGVFLSVSRRCSRRPWNRWRSPLFKF